MEAQASLTDAEIEQKWQDFKIKFKRTYADDKEHDMRKQVFIKAVNMIEEHNAKYRRGETTFTMGINHFADRTEEERKRMC